MNIFRALHFRQLSPQNDHHILIDRTEDRRARFDIRIVGNQVSFTDANNQVFYVVKDASGSLQAGGEGPYKALTRTLGEDNEYDPNCPHVDYPHLTHQQYNLGLRQRKFHHKPIGTRKGGNG